MRLFSRYYETIHRVSRFALIEPAVADPFALSSQNSRYNRYVVFDRVTNSPIAQPFIEEVAGPYTTLPIISDLAGIVTSDFELLACCRQFTQLTASRIGCDIAIVNPRCARPLRRPLRRP
jgi:hypothetical protein